MGIQGLKQFLKKIAPGIFQQHFVTDFYGKRIAIDGDNLLFGFKSTAYKQVVYQTDVAVEEPDMDKVRANFIKRLIDFTIDFLYKGITPIFVFDGEHPIEKQGTKTKRRKNKQKVKDRILELKNEISNLDILSITPLLVTELRKKMCQVSYVSKEDIEIASEILRAMGIPVLNAIGDGEKLCSMLCRENKAHAVYSTDSDLLVLGTSLSIYGMGKYKYDDTSKKYVECFETVTFDGILESLSFSLETFIDLCIMSGCDYNENIPQLGVGRSYKLLKTYKSIDNLPEKYTEKVKEYLNVDFCRSYFQYELSKNLCTHDIVLDVNTDLSNARDCLCTYKAEYALEKLPHAYKNLPKPSTTYISKPVQKITLVID